MKAPDKIYIEIDNKAHVYFGLQPENAVEYIRKEALMEWLKSKIKIPDVSFVNGLTYLAYQDVIEHLNEM